MKIYELRKASEGDADAILDDTRESATQGFLDSVLDPSRLFTMLERAQQAANDEQEELHRDCLTQEQIDSEEVSNVCDDLEWEENDWQNQLAVFTAYNEALGVTWVIREQEVAD